jgi:NAD(P)-dependent dehydrogenase (short-subunit alcohol dehydrogenase family)
MNLALTDKNALICGTPGIVFAIARQVAAEGVRVAAAITGAALRADGSVVRACF